MTTSELIKIMRELDSSHNKLNNLLANLTVAAITRSYVNIKLKAQMI